jgi:putative ABC transport system permease protein
MRPHATVALGKHNRGRTELIGPKRLLQHLPLALRYALRDLIGDPRGFGILIACIVVGVAAISGVSALSHSLATGLAREGRVILGGDISFSLVHRQLDEAERAFLGARGRLSEIALMRAMARREDGEAALIEIKAVDPTTYPPFGQIALDPAQPLDDALREEGRLPGLICDATLLARLDVKIGDVLTIGDERFRLRAALANEPDKLAGGFGYGPRVMMSFWALRATGLTQEGSIVRYLTRIAVRGAEGVASDADVARVVDEAQAAFPLAGWEIRKRDAVSPQFSRNLDRFTQFITLVALTALIAGGAGVANAVNGYVARKRQTFAIMKALGAPGSRVFAIALTQTLAVATLAIAIGLVLGAALPFVAAATLQRLTDLPVVAIFDPLGNALGAVYGALVTLIFALGPLGRAHNAPVAALLRDEVDPTREKPLRRYRVAALLAAASLIGVIMASSSDKKIAAYYLAATVVAFLLLRGVAAGVARLARALPRVKRPQLRLALANIARPHSLTSALVVSIGVTQTLLVALALVEGAIHTEFSRSDSRKTPNFFFIDAPKAQSAEFHKFLQDRAPGAEIEHVPMMRGRIVAVKGVRAEKLRPREDAAWVLEGDRGVTFSDALPSGSQLVAGEWWEKDAKGPPLVSVESRIAEGLDVNIGDEITVNVLGRDVTARVANLRRVDWRSFGINFVLVFSPATFRNAPYSELVTISYGAGDDAVRDARLTREVAKQFPAVATIRVKDALNAVDKIASQLALAARVAAGVAILTAILALTSAVAAGQEARLHDAVVLKTLGATRRWLAGAYSLEFALLGTVAGLFSLAVGSLTAYGLIETLMKMDFVFLPGPIFLTAAGALAFTILLGLAGTWRVLGEKPGKALRRL